jgi:hypothetical protein
LFHDLRRSAARNQRKAGVAESTIMKLGGWKTRSMLLRYDIHDERDLAEAVAAAQALHEAATEGPTRVAQIRADLTPN